MQRSGLQNKVVVITGARSGIGRATSRAFADDGAIVVGVDLRDDLAEAWCKEVQARGGQADWRTLDVSDAGQVADTFRAVGDQHGRIDVLVNNAGIVADAQLIKWKDGSLLGSMAEEDFDRVLDVNLKGVYLCARAAVPWMIPQDSGVILNASSVVALYGNFGQTNYAAAKGGVVAMTRTWARELGRHGIRVNAVAPGFIDTEMLQAIPDKFRDSLAARTPLNRLGRAEEVAEAYRWLASDGASFISGVVLSVDGGVVLGT